MASGHSKLSAIYKESKRKIPIAFQRSVQAFCWRLSRKAANSSSSLRICPDVVQDLILFFYAKPMNMNIEYEKQRKQIMICPIEETWNYLQNALMKELWNLNETLTTLMTINDLEIQSHYGHFNLKLKGEHENAINIGASEWTNSCWNEQLDHTFIVEGSIKRNNAKKMDLVVAAHRGHGGSYRPENLLDGKNDTFYCSKRGSPSVDWIIFKRMTQRSFYPTKLMFRNSSFDGAIKTVTILWSENGKQYHKWTQIGGINKGDQEKQWFNLNEKEIAAVSGKFQYIKLKVDKNYGNSYNALKEFVVHGFH